MFIIGPNQLQQKILVNPKATIFGRLEEIVEISVDFVSISPWPHPKATRQDCRVEVGARKQYIFRLDPLFDKSSIFFGWITIDIRAYDMGNCRIRQWQKPRQGHGQLPLEAMVLHHAHREVGKVTTDPSKMGTMCDCLVNKQPNLPPWKQVLRNF